MLRQWRRVTALVVLGVVVSPWVPTALIALHLQAHTRHSHQESDFGPSASATLHGHHHERGTPEHHHYVTAPESGTVPAKLQLAPLPMAILRVVAASSAVPVRLMEAAGGVGHDPPRQARSVSILRI